MFWCVLSNIKTCQGHMVTFPTFIGRGPWVTLHALFQTRESPSPCRTTIMKFHKLGIFLTWENLSLCRNSNPKCQGVIESKATTRTTWLQMPSCIIKPTYINGTVEPCLSGILSYPNTNLRSRFLNSVSNSKKPVGSETCLLRIPDTFFFSNFSLLLC